MGTASARTTRRARRAGLVVQAGRLGGVSSFVLLLGLLTGPVQARALGVEGRGELATILVPLSLAPFLLDLGLQIFVARDRARGTPARALLGTFVPLSVLLGLVGVLLAVPVARLLADGREDVQLLIVGGLLLSPVSVVLQTVQGVVWGEERFALMGRVRLISALLPAAGILSLAALGRLTVTSAALSFIVGGTLASAPLVRTALRYRPGGYDARLARRGLGFGMRSWLGTLSGVANGRLDQLLMAAIVPVEQLGYYAVAVIAASSAAGLVAAVSTVILPRAARGDKDVIARSARLSVALITLISLLLAFVSPYLIPLLFGEAFQPAVVMVLVLLAGNPAGAAIAVQSSALTAGGRPEVSARIQVIGLVVTAPALILVLPSAGGLGAAVVSTAAAWLMAACVGLASRRHLGLGTRELWVITLDDIAAATRSIRS